MVVLGIALVASTGWGPAPRQPPVEADNTGDVACLGYVDVTGGVAVLDFQDAVRGPVAYDVACLLRDAFHSWPPSQLAIWLDRYHARAQDAGVPVPSRPQFQYDVALTGVQRHLKVLGIFARLHHRDGKPKYLADAPRFVDYLDAALPPHAALAPLARLLDRHVRPALDTVS